MGLFAGAARHEKDKLVRFLESPQRAEAFALAASAIDDIDGISTGGCPLTGLSRRLVDEVVCG